MDPHSLGIPAYKTVGPKATPFPARAPQHRVQPGSWEKVLPHSTPCTWKLPLVRTSPARYPVFCRRGEASDTCSRGRQTKSAPFSLRIKEVNKISLQERCCHIPNDTRGLNTPRVHLPNPGWSNQVTTTTCGGPGVSVTTATANLSSQLCPSADLSQIEGNHHGVHFHF